MVVVGLHVYPSVSRRSKPRSRTESRQGAALCLKVSAGASAVHARAVCVWCLGCSLGEWCWMHGCKGVCHFPWCVWERCVASTC